jgi:hypothetical protein
MADCEEATFQLTIHTLWRVSLPRWKAERQHNHIQHFFPHSSVKYYFFILGNFISSFVMDVVVFKCGLKQTIWRVISQISRLLAEIRLKIPSLNLRVKITVEVSLQKFFSRDVQ